MKQKKIVNLTPHEIKIYDENSDTYEVIKPSGFIANVETVELECVEYKHTPIIIERQKYIELPKESDNTYYIVSKKAFIASNRKDIIFPYQRKRNKAGITVATNNFLGR